MFPGRSGLSDLESGAFVMGDEGRPARERTCRNNRSGNAQSPAYTKHPGLIAQSGVSRSAAASYSPTWWGSTIGAGGLDFSVRDG